MNRLNIHASHVTLDQFHFFFGGPVTIRSFAVFLLAASAAFALPATQLLGAPILPSLAPGSSYQLIFVTSDKIVGSYGTEAPYNALVNADAAPLNTLLASAGITGVTWSAITSTYQDGISAAANAPWGGVPVYDTQATQVNIPTYSLYYGALQSPVSYDEDGFFVNNSVWTGSTPTGIGAQELGQPDQHPATSGLTLLTNGLWLDAETPINTDGLQVFGLSSVITNPTPEPATITLLGTGIFLMAGMRFLPRRRKAYELILPAGRRMSAKRLSRTSPIKCCNWAKRMSWLMLA
jgi:hypothetical protein